MIASILLAAVTGVTAFPPPGSYRYSASLAGQPIGEWSVTVKQDATDTQIDENSTATVMGMQLAATASLVLGSDLAPTTYSGDYTISGQNRHVSATLTSSSASVIAVTSNQPLQLALFPATRHFVVVEQGLLAGLFALPAQLAAWKESSVTWISPATGQAQVLGTALPAGSRPPNGVPANDALISIDRPLAVAIWYDPTSFVPDQISVPSQSAVLTRQK
jgi:hypothetical protein